MDAAPTHAPWRSPHQQQHPPGTYYRGDGAPCRCWLTWNGSPGSGRLASAPAAFLPLRRLAAGLPAAGSSSSSSSSAHGSGGQGGEGCTPALRCHRDRQLAGYHGPFTIRLTFGAGAARAEAGSQRTGKEWLELALTLRAMPIIVVWLHDKGQLSCLQGQRNTGC